MARQEVEGNRRRRPLPLMVHRQRPQGLIDCRHRVQRNELTGAGFDEEEIQGIRIGRELLLQFENDVVLSGGGIDGTDLAPGKGVAQGVLDLLGREPQGGGLVAIDVDRHLQAPEAQVAAHVRQPRQGSDPLLEVLAVPVEVGEILALQGIVVHGIGFLATDLDGRGIHGKDKYPGNGVDLGTELVDDLIDGPSAFLAIHAPGEDEPLVVVGDGGDGYDPVHIGIVDDDLVDDVQVGRHIGIGYRIGGHGVTDEKITILAGDETSG